MDKTEKEVFERKLDELVREIGMLPASQRDKLVVLAKQSHDCQDKLKRSVDNLQESLDYLRISVKYILFDLDATRRENAYLRKMGPIIRENNGFIDKYIGDAIMALFINADDALKAAMTMHDELLEFNKAREHQGFPVTKIV